MLQQRPSTAKEIFFKNIRGKDRNLHRTDVSTVPFLRTQGGQHIFPSQLEGRLKIQKPRKWSRFEAQNLLPGQQSPASSFAEVLVSQSCPILATPWTAACQAPLSMGISRQEYWSGLLCPPSGDSSQPRDRTHVSCSFCSAGEFFTAQPPGKPT